MTTATVTSLRALAREYLDRDVVDAREIAAEMARDLDEETVIEVLTEALVPYVRDVIRTSRHKARKELGPRSSPRWERARGVDRIFQALESVDGEYKPYGSLTRVEVETIADDFDRRAQEIHDVADQHRRVAAMMRKHHASRVSDLGERILDVFEA